MTRNIPIACLTGIALAVLVCGSSAAQTLGTVTGSTAQSCANRNFAPGMSCYAATLHGCPGDDDLQFVYGVQNPSGTPFGTIVILSGGGGGKAADTPADMSYVSSYVAAGYQVVEIAWGPTNPVTGGGGFPWEETAVTSNSTNTSYSIRTAACRPASFLNWVRNGGTVWSGGGMCAQGSSAGSGAIAYALAWYNAGAATASNGQGYLDKVVLEAGPVFSDIKQGCEVSANGTNNQATRICQSNQNQAGCQGWNIIQDPPGSSLEYVDPYNGYVENWTGGTAVTGMAQCANNSQQTTYDTTWYKMSIVDTSETQQPSFNYPNTAMSAWLCETYVPGVVPDNVGAQGELFYLQFTSSSQAANSLTVNALTSCPSAENIESGVPPTYTGQSTGQAAIIQDMSSQGFLGGSGVCKARH